MKSQFALAYARATQKDDLAGEVAAAKAALRDELLNNATFDLAAETPHRIACEFAKQADPEDPDIASAMFAIGIAVGQIFSREILNKGGAR